MNRVVLSRASLRAAIVAALVSPVVPGRTCHATPVVDGTNANTWVYLDDRPDSVPVPWRVLSSSWTLSAVAAGVAGVAVDGTPLPGVQSPTAVMVNDARGSYQPGGLVLAPGAAAVSILGLGLPAVTTGDPAPVGPELRFDTPERAFAAPRTASFYVPGVPAGAQVCLRLAQAHAPAATWPAAGDAVRYTGCGRSPSGTVRIDRADMPLAWAITFSPGPAPETVAVPQRTTFTVALPGPAPRASDGRWRAKDTDADGVPDLVEMAYGGDAESADLDVDTDADGLTDFDEWVRGSDPLDPTDLPTDWDGDGWPDWDEQRRGTSWDGGADPGASASFPAAARLTEVEHSVTLAATRDGNPLNLVSGAAALDAADLSFRGIAARSATGTGLPIALGAGAPPAGGPAYDLGALPAMRLPAGTPVVLRARRFAADASCTLADGNCTSRAFLPGRADLRPSDVDAYMDENPAAPRWNTADDWRNAYAAMYQASAVQAAFDTPLNRYSDGGVALLEALLAWENGRTSGQHLLLGTRQAGAPTGAAGALGARVGENFPPTGSAIAASDAISRLHAALSAAALPGGLTANVRTLQDAIAALFALPAGGAFTDEQQRLRTATTDAALAGLLQDVGLPLVAPTEAFAVAHTATARRLNYVARLLATLGPNALAALSAGQRAALLDPTGDADGDGLANQLELFAPVGVATRPDAADSDADGIGDAADLCPTDAENVCMLVDSLNRDLDADGVVDAVDNCVGLSNGDQADANNDGIGDACNLVAAIAEPAADVIVPTGTVLQFRMRAAAGESAADHRWTFGGLAPDFDGPGPGPVFAGTPGVYLVTLTSTSANPGARVTVDRRTVDVRGPVRASPALQMVADVSIEGGTTTVAAYAPAGGTTIGEPRWRLPGGGFAQGESVAVEFPADGTYHFDATAKTGDGLKLTGSLDVDVPDSVPAASFSFAVLDAAEGTVQFTDTSTAYDGLVSAVWDFGDLTPGASGNSVVHDFAGGGDFTVTLTVTDGDGSVATATRVVTVDSPVVQPSSCTRAGTLVTLAIGRLNEARLVRSGTAITAVGAGIADPTCGGATVSIVDTIVVTGSTGAESFTLDLGGGTFAPGKAKEPGETAEIELSVDLGPGYDSFVVQGGASSETWRVLPDWSVRLNTDADADLTIAGVEELSLRGGNGNETITIEATTGVAGGPSTLEVEGEIGNDTLIGGPGDESLYGGDGNDRLQPNGGTHVVSGGAGIDTLDYTTQLAGMNVDLAAGTATGASTDQIDTIEKVWGSAFPDTLRGSAGNDTLEGRGGADHLLGGDGVDTLLGGADADTLEGEGGNDVLKGEDGDDLVSGGPGNDTLYGYAGFDDLRGGEGNDTLYGGADDDTLNGELGNDRLYGEDGDDVLLGEAGSDTLQGGNGDDDLYGGNDTDTLFGGSGADLLDGGAGTADTADFGGSAAGVVADLLLGTASGDGEDVLVGVERLLGSSFDDTLRGDAQVNYLDGRAGNDTVDGRDNNDTLIGGAGDDILIGGGGTADIASYQAAPAGVTIDLLAGTGAGDGNDTLATIERVYGSAYDDILSGDNAANYLRGMNGNDQLFGRGGADLLQGDAGADTFDGGTEKDTCRSVAGEVEVKVACEVN